MKTVWKDVKCTKQFVPIAVRNAKFPSNLTAQDQYTAESALPREDPPEQTDHTEDTKQRIYRYQQIEG